MHNTISLTVADATDEDAGGFIPSINLSCRIPPPQINKFVWRIASVVASRLFSLA
jgi:hypothetical protein